MAQLVMALDQARRIGAYRITDPGPGNEIPFRAVGQGIVLVRTATAESRVLPPAVSNPVGTKLTVILKKDGGDLTITGAAVNVVLADAGDVAEFVVTDNNGTHAWRLVLYSPAGDGGGLETADTSGATEIAATASLTDQVIVDALLELTAALLAAGIISDDFTQAA